MEVNPAGRPSARKALESLLENPRCARYHLTYDPEDQPAAAQLVRAMQDRRLESPWDQDWPCWEDFDAQSRKAISRADALIVYATSNVHYNQWIKNDIAFAKHSERFVILLETNGDHEFDAGPDGLKVDINGLGAGDAAGKVITRLGPSLKPKLPIAPKPMPSLTDVEAMLAEALKANLGIPSDTITEKVFLSPDACRWVCEAYQTARRIANCPPTTSQIMAYLEYGRLLRFQGEWDKAQKVFDEALQAMGPNHPLEPSCRLERGARVRRKALRPMGSTRFGQ